jgi:hypothetical protein
MGFAQIDDADALTMIENERLRTGIPAFGLVSEVDASV